MGTAIYCRLPQVLYQAVGVDVIAFVSRTRTAECHGDFTNRLVVVNRPTFQSVAEVADVQRITITRQLNCCRSGFESSV